MPNLYAEENRINRTRGWRYGDSGVYETSYETTGALYRAMRKEYGRCTGRVMIDDKGGRSKPIGWVFLKRDRYDDCNDTFLSETWVTVHTAPPTKTIKYQYA